MRCQDEQPGAFAQSASLQCGNMRRFRRGEALSELAQPRMNQRLAQDADVAGLGSIGREVGVHTYHVQAIAALLQHLDLRFAAKVNEVVVVTVKVIEAGIDPDNVAIFQFGPHRGAATGDDLDPSGLRQEA